MKANKKNFSRRDFIFGSGKTLLGMTAFDTIFGSLLSSHLNPALAAADTPIKNFINLNLFGAPPRWMWDLILNPTNDSTKFLNNPMVSNHYSTNSAGDRYINAGYRLVNYKNTGTFVPYLLGQSIPLGSGMTKAWDLLDHMISIRGIDVLNAAHQGASSFHQSAILGSPTISSPTADRAASSATDPSQNILRAVSIDPNSGSVFSSKTGVTQFRTNTEPNGTTLNKMFSSLRPISTSSGFSQAFIGNKNKLEVEIQQALNSLDPTSASYYQAMMDNNERAMRILNDSAVTAFSNLLTEGDELFLKYKLLIQKTIEGVYVGINDKPIGQSEAAAADQGKYQIALGEYATNNKNLSGQFDLRTLFSRQASATATPELVNFDRLAAQFAVIEFLVTRGMSPSVSVMQSPFGRLNVGTTAPRPMIFDQHFVGYMPGIFINSMYYLSLNCCILNLIEALKLKGIFNDTLIYLASEFNRAARVDGSGADHGAPATHVNLISGRISEFKLIGNIYKDSAGVGLGFSKSYKGTWGHGAPLSDNASLNIVQVWASVMRVLGLSPTDLPNAVNKANLIFNGSGNFDIAAFYANPNNRKNIANVSKS